MATHTVEVTIADAKEVREALEKATCIVEQFHFVRDVLSLLAETNCLMAIWWRCDGEYAPITFFVNANDLFEWACADCEQLTPEDVPALRAAISEVSAIDECEKEAGFQLWVARKRGIRPHYPAYPKNERLQALFDACGPARTKE